MWPSEIPHQYAVGRLPAPGPPEGAPANGGGRCWVAGRGHAPPEGGCGRWPAGALPRWLPFLVKQVLKQATTCFRTALNCEGMRRQSLLSGERKDPPIYIMGAWKKDPLAALVVCPTFRGRTEVQIPMALREAEGRRTTTTSAAHGRATTVVDPTPNLQSGATKTRSASPSRGKSGRCPGLEKCIQKNNWVRVGYGS